MILGSALLSLLLSKSPIFGIGSIFWLFICALNERESERKKEMVKEKRWDWKCVTMRPLAFPPLSCKCTTVAKISKWRLHRIWMECIPTKKMRYVTALSSKFSLNLSTEEVCNKTVFLSFVPRTLLNEWLENN